MRRAIGVAFMALLWAGGMFLVVVWLLNYLDGTRQNNLLLLIGGFMAAVATVVLAEDALGLAGRRKKPPWEVEYAQNIYEGFVDIPDPGNMTALTLKIPSALHHAYDDKMLFQRELFSFAALLLLADRGSLLMQVTLAYGDLLVQKMAKRGLQVKQEQLAEAALGDVQSMTNAPIQWAQRWLSEFRDDPNDMEMVLPFADHWMRILNANKSALEQTKPR